MVSEIFILLILVVPLSAEQRVVTVEQIHIGNDIDSRVDKIPGFEQYQNSGDSCDNNKFHPANLLMTIAEVSYVEDCILLCRMNYDCHSATLVTRLMECFLSSSRVMSIEDTFNNEIESKYCKVKNFQNSEPKPPLLNDGESPNDCGVSHFPENLKKSRTKRIIGGEEAPYYSAPWMVELFNKEGFFCGGSIITNDGCFVLTAAHCFFIDDESTNTSSVEQFGVIVRAGSHDQRFTEAHEQSLKIRRIIFHSNFENVWYYPNDILLLEMQQCFTLNNFVRHVCLPKNNESIEILPDQHCFLAGWGCSIEQFDYVLGKIVSIKDGPKLKRASVYARKVKAPGVRAILFFRGGAGRGSEGDSGGPLFCRFGKVNRYTVYGVLSSVNKEMKLNYFTEISEYRQWIDDIIKSTRTGSMSEDHVNYAVYDAKYSAE